MKNSYRIIGAGLVLIGLAGAAGCSLKRNLPEQHRYALEARRPGGSGPSSTSGDAVIYLRTLRASPFYEGQEFVYRKKDGTFETDFHNQFFVLPAQQITGEVRQWLSGAGFIRGGIATPGIAGASHVLTGSIEALYGDYRGDLPTAVLELDFIVLKSTDEPEILFHRKYHEEVAFAKGSPTELVAGWNTGLRRILSRLEDDLRELDLS